jgi:miniconductance mechanosensitive channel
MPQLGADGDVIDLALHTVKVQNWDKTITTIPTWRLMSESFRNWRGMSESGGRRIKRTLRVDAASVHFLDREQIDRLMKIAVLRPYMSARLNEVEKTNADRVTQLGELASAPANQRRLTNLGTFRAYIDAWLRAHPAINTDMTFIVRAMEPSPEGVPMEIYCFTSTTRWAEYEAIQSDIFDHLLAILPEFGLRLYQKPSGHDLSAGIGAAIGSDAPRSGSNAAGAAGDAHAAATASRSAAA